MTRAPGAVAAINVTPLIDVMLVLLILFMVVTPVAPRGLDASLPAEGRDGVEPGPPVPLVLSVEPDRLSLNGLPITTLGDLEALLRDAFMTRGERTLFVKASGAVAYRHVVESLDAARGAGAERIGLLREGVKR
jgi:biopolymer transport protein ExbD